MLSLHGQDGFHHAARGGIAVTEELDDLAIAVDRNALGNQLFADHVGQRLAFDILGVGPAGQPVGRAPDAATTML